MLLAGTHLPAVEKNFHYTNTVRMGIAGFMALCTWMLFQLVGIPGILDPITTDLYSTRTELLRTIGYGCFFFVSVRLLSSQKRIEIVLYLVVLLGMLEALSGSVQQLLFELARARGSFPNPNHSAGFLEVTLANSIGLILAQQGDRKVSSNPVIEFITGPRGRLRLIIIIMVIGLVMSRSRMGNIGFLTSILISSGIAFYYSKKYPKAPSR